MNPTLEQINSVLRHPQDNFYFPPLPKESAHNHRMRLTASALHKLFRECEPNVALPSTKLDPVIRERKQTDMSETNTNGATPAPQSAPDPLEALQASLKALSAQIRAIRKEKGIKTTRGYRRKNMMFAPGIGGVVRKHRFDLGLTHKKYAKHVGLPSGALPHLEINKRGPSWAEIEKLAKVMGIPASELLKKAEDNKAPLS